MTENDLENLKVALGNVTVENAAIKERVRLLEQRLKQSRFSMVMLPLVIFLIVTNMYFWSKTFSGRWMALHDEQGNMRVWIDENGLELKDRSGAMRARLAMAPSGDPTLQLFDNAHHMRAQLFVYPGDGSAYLMMWDKDGKGVRYPPSPVPLP